MIILLIVLLVFAFYCLYVHITTISRIKNAFERNNVIVYGKKGTGKDLLFQKIINVRKKPYYSNISFGGDFHECSFHDLELPHNTYKNFIDGNIEIEEKKGGFEKSDFYFSDMGIHIPSQCDSLLHKVYPSLPISYALSRHLYNNNIHGNAQNLERIWKALREQADYFIKCRRVLWFGFFGVGFVCTYDKYESAKANLLPMRKSLFNKYNVAEFNQFEATNGEIKNGFYFLTKKSISYDTRAYHKLIFGVEAPKS